MPDFKGNYAAEVEKQEMCKVTAVCKRMVIGSTISSNSAEQVQALPYTQLEVTNYIYRFYNTSVWRTKTLTTHRQATTDTFALRYYKSFFAWRQFKTSFNDKTATFRYDLVPQLTALEMVHHNLSLGAQPCVFGLENGRDGRATCFQMYVIWLDGWISRVYVLSSLKGGLAILSLQKTWPTITHVLQKPLPSGSKQIVC